MLYIGIICRYAVTLRGTTEKICFTSAFLVIFHQMGKDMCKYGAKIGHNYYFNLC